MEYGYIELTIAHDVHMQSKQFTCSQCTCIDVFCHFINSLFILIKL